MVDIEKMDPWQRSAWLIHEEIPRQRETGDPRLPDTLIESQDLSGRLQELDRQERQAIRKARWSLKYIL